MSSISEVKALRIGRSAAKDKLKRALVSAAELDKVTEKTTGTVADMLRLIWITAMRPSEVCRMRPFDILRKDKACWLYVPGRDASMILCEADPIGINCGCNTDEYDLEAQTIVPRLKDCSCEAHVLRVVLEEFAKWFGARYAEPQERYTEAAKHIWQLCQRQGLRGCDS